MGFSCFHSVLVELILNPHTGNISPQFHVVYDDFFSTVHHNVELESAKQWNKLFTSSFSRVRVLLNKTDDVKLSEEWLTVGEQCAHALQNIQNVRSIPDLHKQDSPSQDHLQTATPMEDTAQAITGMRPTENASGSAENARNISGGKTDLINSSC